MPILARLHPYGGPLKRYLWLVVAGVGVWTVYTFAADGRWLLALLFGVIDAGLAWWVSPWRGGRSLSHADVMGMPQTERPVVIYWRPGCPFCARLKSSLGSAGKHAQWVNIWQDKEAAEFVRSVNDGNETVPTVVLDGNPITNPEPHVVAQRLNV